MLPELSEVKAKRKHLGLSQNGLCAKTGVSQSLIAKLESGKISPSYSSAKKIFDFFEQVKQETTANAKDIMTRKVITVKENAQVRDAIKAMKKNGISQLPIVNGEVVVGTISEKLIVDRIREEKDVWAFMEKKVSEIMEDSLPQITQTTGIEIISAMLESSPAVLVTKNGRLEGIISRSNVLDAMLKPKKGLQ